MAMSAMRSLASLYQALCLQGILLFIPRPLPNNHLSGESLLRHLDRALLGVVTCDYSSALIDVSSKLDTHLQ